MTIHDQKEAPGKQNSLEVEGHLIQVIKTK